MKRDWKLIKTILAKVEAERLAEFLDQAKEIDYDTEDLTAERNRAQELEAVVAGHLLLLTESGFIVGIKVTNLQKGNVSYSMSSPRLTMDGHDLLEILRTDKTWNRITKAIKETGCALTITAIKTFTEEFIKSVSRNGFN